MTLTIKEDGPRAILTASRPDDGRGLYKAWVVGPSGRCLLGTMAPEGGRLSIRRTLSLSELRRCGAWPAEGGEAELSFPFPGKDLPSGWREAGGGTAPFAEGELERMARALPGALRYTDRGGFFLAAPYRPDQPFPLPPLFCLASVERLGGSDYAVFCFDREGRPCFPNNGNTSRPY